MKSRLQERMAPPPFRRTMALASLILIERMGQRHQKSAAGRWPTSSATVPKPRSATRPDELAAIARRQVVEKKGAMLGVRPAPWRIARARAGMIFLARLLDDLEPHLQHAARVRATAAGHDIGHDARTLAAAEHQQTQRTVGLDPELKRRLPPTRSPPAAPDCRMHVVLDCERRDRLSVTPAKPVAMALTLAGQKFCWRGPSRHSVRAGTVGMFCTELAANTGGTDG